METDPTKKEPFQILFGYVTDSAVDPNLKPQDLYVLDLLDPYPDPLLFVQILPSLSNNSKKIHVFYCFVTSL
jgi:hypothetical protein